MKYFITVKSVKTQKYVAIHEFDDKELAFQMFTDQVKSVSDAYYIDFNQNIRGAFGEKEKK